MMEPAKPSPKVLIYGGSTELMEALPALFRRAGFAVHVLCVDKTMASHPCVNEVSILGALEDVIATAASAVTAQHYDVVIAGDDETLSAILDSSLAAKSKRALLPVNSTADFSHISSKIGLAQLFESANITCPPSLVAYNRDELLKAAQRIGFPLFVKDDKGSGGKGVIPINAIDELSRLMPAQYPVLVQASVSGVTYDLSGFFWQGDVVWYSISEYVSTVNGPLGPSVVRKYRRDLKFTCANELRRIARVTGINGFANVTAIMDSRDKNFYFIEADARPNVWIEYGASVDDDPAKALATKFGGCYLGESKRKTRINEMVAYAPRVDLVSYIIDRYGNRTDYPNYLGRPLLRKKLMQSARARMRALKAWMRA